MRIGSQLTNRQVLQQFTLDLVQAAVVGVQHIACMRQHLAHGLSLAHGQGPGQLGHPLQPAQQHGVFTRSLRQLRQALQFTVHFSLHRFGQTGHIQALTKPRRFLGRTVLLAQFLADGL